MRYLLKFILGCLLSSSVLAEGPQKDDVLPAEDVGSEREAKQFWPIIHASGPPLLPPHTGSLPPLISPFPSAQPIYSANRAVQQKNKKVPEARAAETPEAEATEAAELALVESVNHMLGAMGRQGINGADIFSEDDVSVLPGRPNAEPTESHLTHPSGSPSRRRNQECCLFVFFDGSAYYFDDYLRMLTGPYRLMYGTVNGHPHYVARGCNEPDVYGPNCSYIWHSGYGWIIGIGTYIGQTKGVVYTRTSGSCPTEQLASWRYLNKDLNWKDNGNIILECAS